MNKFLKEQWFRFDKIGTITMLDIYKMVKQHSRLIDRLNPKKMLFMTFYAFDILNGSIEEPKDKNWNFFDIMKLG